MSISALLAHAAVTMPPLPVSTGWSPTTWVTGITGGGIFGAIVTLIVKVQRNSNDRAQQDGDREAAREGSRWSEIMALVKLQAERIDALEKAGAEQVRTGAIDIAAERKRCDAEMAELRKDHAAEVADIRKELAGVYRLIGGQSSANARMFEPRADLPEDMKTKLRALDQGAQRNDGGSFK